MFDRHIEEWCIREPKGEVKNCIIGLPGRGNPAELMISAGLDMAIPETLIVAVRPSRYAWYPQPYSAIDQKDAIGGLPHARKLIRQVITRVRRVWNLKPCNIALIGFSAGAVMALDVGVRDQLAGVISFSGAILDPGKVPKAKPQGSTPIMLIHGGYDECFDWDERYLPMKKALEKQGYDLSCRESQYGRHAIYVSDIWHAANFLAKCFPLNSTLDDWVHPKLQEELYDDDDDDDDDEEEDDDE